MMGALMTYLEADHVIDDAAAVEGGLELAKLRAGTLRGVQKS
jgi:hypothetical protein